MGSDGWKRSIMKNGKVWTWQGKLRAHGGKWKSFSRQLPKRIQIHGDSLGREIYGNIPPTKNAQLLFKVQKTSERYLEVSPWYDFFMALPVFFFSIDLIIFYWSVFVKIPSSSWSTWSAKNEDRLFCNKKNGPRKWKRENLRKS
jgi:hypothetical protein